MAYLETYIFRLLKSMQFLTILDNCVCSDTVDPQYNVNFGIPEKLTLYEILRYIED